LKRFFGKVTVRLDVDLTLVVGEATFPVASQPLRQACDLFASGCAPSHYNVHSQAALSLFSLFLKAVSGKDIQITNENVSDLSQLCDEFGFWSLSSTQRLGPSTTGRKARFDPRYHVHRKSRHILFLSVTMKYHYDN
jgi:hypothetical protein